MKFLILSALVLASIFYVSNAYADNQVTIIANMPLEKVDQSYKTLPINYHKETIIIYEKDLTVTHTSGVSAMDGKVHNGFLVQGSCLNEYSLGSSIPENDSCEDVFSLIPSQWNESQFGSFLVFQLKDTSLFS